MRKTTSKIIALLLALSVLFCLATPAGALEFEGETDDGSWQGDCGDGGNDYQLLGRHRLGAVRFLYPMEENKKFKKSLQLA